MFTAFPAAVPQCDCTHCVPMYFFVDCLLCYCAVFHSTYVGMYAGCRGTGAHRFESVPNPVSAKLVQWKTRQMVIRGPELYYINQYTHTKLCTFQSFLINAYNTPLWHSQTLGREHCLVISTRSVVVSTIFKSTKHNQEKHTIGSNRERSHLIVILNKTVGYTRHFFSRHFLELFLNLWQWLQFRKSNIQVVHLQVSTAPKIIESLHSYAGITIIRILDAIHSFSRRLLCVTCPGTAWWHRGTLYKKLNITIDILYLPKR